MTTSEIIYTGLLLIILIIQYKVIRRTFNYREEESTILQEGDDTKFLFPTNDWMHRVGTNVFFIFSLSARPYDNLVIASTVLIGLLIVNTLIVIAFRNSEIMTIDAFKLTFRFGSDRDLEEIQRVSFEEKWVVLQAKNHPKETRFYKNSFKGDWDQLCLALFEFASRNPEIEISGNVSKAPYSL